MRGGYPGLFRRGALCALRGSSGGHQDYVGGLTLFAPRLRKSFSTNQRMVTASTEFSSKNTNDQLVTFAFSVCQSHETRFAGKPRMTAPTRVVIDRQLVRVSQPMSAAMFAIHRPTCTTVPKRMNGIALILIIVMMNSIVRLQAAYTSLDCNFELGYMGYKPVRSIGPRSSCLEL